MEALTAGRDESYWPGGKDPQFDDAFRQRFEGLRLDPNDPLFSQSFWEGADATTASAGYGEVKIDLVVNHLVEQIQRHEAAS